MNKYDRDPWHDAETVPLWFFWLIIVVLVSLLVAGALSLIGCQQQQSDIDTVPEAERAELVRWKTKTVEVMKTNWLATLFILAAALSVVIICQGKVYQGGTALAGSLFGLFLLSTYQAFATHPYWPLVCAGVLVVSAVGLAGWAIYVKNKDLFNNKRAFKEVVFGVEKVKTADPRGYSYTTEVIKFANKHQSKMTKKMVDKVQEQLKEK